MALFDDHVRIQNPCPVSDLPADRASGPRAWHCGHCEKSVHVLSVMTELEARAFLTDHAGESLCVSYAVRADGSIRFRPEPAPAKVIPVGALVRRRRLAAAAVGFGAALAACAPHDNPDVNRLPTIVSDRLPESGPASPTIPDVQSPRDRRHDRPVGLVGVRPVPPPDEALVDGEIDVRPPPAKDSERVVDGELRAVAPPAEQIVEGGLKVLAPPATAAKDEPCDPPGPEHGLRRGDTVARPVP